MSGFAKRFGSAIAFLDVWFKFEFLAETKKQQFDSASDLPNGARHRDPGREYYSGIEMDSLQLFGVCCGSQFELIHGDSM